MAREDPQLKFRVPAELRAQLEQAAHENNRSLSAEIVQRLESYEKLQEKAVALEQECHKLNAEVMRRAHAQAESRMTQQFMLRLISQAKHPEENGIDVLELLNSFERSEQSASPIRRPSPDRGYDLVHVDENGFETWIQTKVSRALDNKLADVTSEMLKKWAEQIAESYSMVEKLTPEEARAFLNAHKATEAKDEGQIKQGSKVSGSNYWRNKQAARRERIAKESGKPDAAEIERAEREAHAQAVFPHLGKLNQQDKGQKVSFLSRQARKRAMKNDEES